MAKGGEMDLDLVWLQEVGLPEPSLAAGIDYRACPNNTGWMDLQLVHCVVPDLHTWRKTRGNRHGDGKGKAI